MASPRLFEHDRHNTRDELPRAKAIAIAKCFGLEQGDVSDYDRRLARETLDWLRTRQCWIACGCMDGPTKPLLIPAMREGVLYLRRHAETAHQANCPLRQPPGEERSQPADPAGAAAPISSWEGGWNLSELAANKVAEKKDVKPPLTSRSPRPYLPEAGPSHAVGAGASRGAPGFGRRRRL